jgi:hypothetical protein
LELSSNTFCKLCADSDICSAFAAGAELADLETLFANLTPVSKALTMPFTGAAKSSISPRRSAESQLLSAGITKFSSIIPSELFSQLMELKMREERKLEAEYERKGMLCD